MPLSTEDGENLPRLSRNGAGKVSGEAVQAADLNAQIPHIPHGAA